HRGGRRPVGRSMRDHRQPAMMRGGPEMPKFAVGDEVVVSYKGTPFRREGRVTAVASLGGGPAPGGSESGSWCAGAGGPAGDGPGRQGGVPAMSRPQPHTDRGRVWRLLLATRKELARVRAAAAARPPERETLVELLARHRAERRDLLARHGAERRSLMIRC